MLPGTWLMWTHTTMHLMVHQRAHVLTKTNLHGQRTWVWCSHSVAFLVCTMVLRLSSRKVVWLTKVQILHSERLVVHILVVTSRVTSRLPTSLSTAMLLAILLKPWNTHSHCISNVWLRSVWLFLLCVKVNIALLVAMVNLLSNVVIPMLQPTHMY